MMKKRGHLGGFWGGVRRRTRNGGRRAWSDGRSRLLRLGVGDARDQGGHDSRDGHIEHGGVGGRLVRRVLAVRVALAARLLPVRVLAAMVAAQFVEL